MRKFGCSLTRDQLRLTRHGADTAALPAGLLLDLALCSSPQHANAVASAAASRLGLADAADAQTNAKVAVILSAGCR